jgi:hypothetical protein
MKVLKFGIPITHLGPQVVEFQVELPEGAVGEALSCVVKCDDQPYIYVSCKPGRPAPRSPFKRKFDLVAVSTGDEFNEHTRFIGTVSLHGGQAVYHVFEVTAPADLL